MLKILKSKRGVAIENAILFLLVIFMLCALLASITIIANFQFKIDNMVLKNDVDLDQIGEDFIAYLASDETDFDTFLTAVAYADETKKEKYDRIYNKYDCEIIGSTLTVKSGDTVLMYVRANKDDNGVSVNTWQHSVPTSEETILDSLGNYFLEYSKTNGEIFNPDVGYDYSLENVSGYQKITFKNGADDTEVATFILDIYENAMLVKDESPKSILYIRKEIIGGEVRISTWRYSGSTSEEKEIDDIGDKISLSLSQNSTFSLSDEDKYEYVAGETESGTKHIVTIKETGKTVLYIEVNSENEITEWRYSAPEAPAESETPTDSETPVEPESPAGT